MLQNIDMQTSFLADQDEQFVLHKTIINTGNTNQAAPYY